MIQLDKYKKLIEQFLKKEISVSYFEETYREIFLNDHLNVSRECFELLNTLFIDALNFTDEPLDPEDNPASFVTEDKLREYAVEALQGLQKLEKENRLI